MDFLDDEATPEEQKAALIQALQARMGGQQQPSRAEFQQGWGSLNMRSGDKVLSALGQSQIGQGEHMAARAQQAQQAGLAQALQAQREKTRRAQELFDTRSQRAYQEQRDIRQNAAELAQAQAAAGQKAAERAAPKPITAAEASQIGTFGTAIEAADALSTAWDKDTDSFSGVTQFVPGTDSKQYANKADVAAQVIGGILEEGKLGEADLPRYKAMMPQGGDSKGTKAKKVASLKEMIGLKRSGKIKGLGQAGFDVSGFGGQEPKGGSFDLGSKPAARTVVKDKGGKVIGYINPDGSEEWAK